MDCRDAPLSLNRRYQSVAGHVLQLSPPARRGALFPDHDWRAMSSPPLSLLRAAGSLSGVLARAALAERGMAVERDLESLGKLPQVGCSLLETILTMQTL